jgi:hypothetical protein
VIVLHSPATFAQTGLPTCPLEKTAAKLTERINHDIILCRPDAGPRFGHRLTATLPGASNFAGRLWIRNQKAQRNHLSGKRTCVSGFHPEEGIRQR